MQELLKASVKFGSRLCVPIDVESLTGIAF